jgi:ATP-binding cassette subfamily C (CFTR/MRP) protein 4
MGQLMDPILYRKVVDACGLLTDFRKFVNNDQTILGEKGVQCSGGQRARIGLARALYRDADVLILDDPLSAVDSRVGRQIYDTLEDLALKQGKCIVLATHQLQYLGNGPSVHMSNGKLTYCSDMEHCVDDTVVVDCQGGDDIHEYAEDVTVDNFVADEEESESDEHDPNKVQDVEGLADRQGDKEIKVTGAVSSSTLRRYINSMGTARATVCLSLSFLIVEGVLLLTYSYLGHLADMEDQRSGKVLATILGLVFALMLFTFYRSTSFYSLATGASGKIHDDMIRSVFRSKMQFFDVNPSGR